MLGGMHQVFRITLDDALPMLAGGPRQGRGARRQADHLRLRRRRATSSPCTGCPGARLTGVEISIAKAFTAAGHERATHLFNEPPNGPALPGNEAFGIAHMLPGQVRHLRRRLPASCTRARSSAPSACRGGNGEQDKAVGAAALQAFAEHVAGEPAGRLSHLHPPHARPR